MKLVPVATVRTALAVASITDIDTAIGLALDKATEEIASDLRLETFARGSFADVFFAHKRMPNNAYEFLLTNGFLVVGEDITVTYSTLFADAASDPTWTLVSGEDYLSSLPKGYVETRGWALDKKYIRVTYTSGFEVDGDDDELYDQTQVPTWLQLAAVAKAQHLLLNSPLLTFEGTQKPEIADLRSDYTKMAVPHIRYKPLAFIPISSVAL